MGRRDLPKQRERLVSVVLNRAGEVVSLPGNMLRGDEPSTLAVLVHGGQLLHLPASSARQLSLWDVVQITEISITPGAAPVPMRIQEAGPNVGSRFD